MEFQMSKTFSAVVSTFLAFGVIALAVMCTMRQEQIVVEQTKIDAAITKVEEKITLQRELMDKMKLEAIIAEQQISQMRDEIVAAKVELAVTKANLQVTTASLKAAIIPQATVTAAVKENIVAPVATVTTNLWKDTKEIAVVSWNRVFN
jgi:septal ring factor EnvC (AmiA/AmiB activator)